MPFKIETKTEMFINCGRLCCLCLKQCGTNIEAAHIIDEAAGGTNDADNGIPLCFDCHQEIGGYNDKHPKGNKFRPEELRARRDRIYGFVETGVIYAQMVAGRSRSADVGSNVPELSESTTPSRLSVEAERFLKRILEADGSLQGADRKLSLFGESTRAQILDELQRQASESNDALSALTAIVQGSTFPKDQAVLLVEQAVRSVTLFGDVSAKAILLRDLVPETLESVYEGVRLAFFDDLVSIVRRDQFDDVNEIVPVLVNHVGAVPVDLRRAYVTALLEQGRSHSYRGAPAARRGLAMLPDAVAKAAIDALDVDFLYWNFHEHVKSFVARYRKLADPGRQQMLDDFVSLHQLDFMQKYKLPDST